MENKDLSQPGKENPGHKKPSPKKKKGFMGWVQRNMVVTLLLILIIAGGIYALIRISAVERQSITQRQELITQYESSLDSLRIAGMERAVRTLSWAIRSEMSRQNLEQVDQFFSTFVNEQDVQRLRLIDPSTGDVILSTDRNDQNTRITQARILQAEEVFTIRQDSLAAVVSPIMGLSERLGILVVDFIP
ncbi:MAG: hypothetical protein R6U64_03950 [Bacteroidales bacterium]